MASATRYLLTVDSQSGELVKVQQMGEAGDLADVDARWFASHLMPPRAAEHQAAHQDVHIHLHVDIAGGDAHVAYPRLTVPAPGGPGSPLLGPAGPGGPGGPGAGLSGPAGPGAPGGPGDPTTE